MRQSIVRIIPFLAMVSSSTTTTLSIVFILSKRQTQRHGSPVLLYLRMHPVCLPIIDFQDLNDIVKSQMSVPLCRCRAVDPVHHIRTHSTSVIGHGDT